MNIIEIAACAKKRLATVEIAASLDDFAKGDRVIVNFGTIKEPEYYLGTVQSRSPAKNSVSVLYDDGSKHVEPLDEKGTGVVGFVKGRKKITRDLTAKQVLELIDLDRWHVRDIKKRLQQNPPVVHAPAAKDPGRKDVPPVKPKVDETKDINDWLKANKDVMFSSVAAFFKRNDIKQGKGTEPSTVRLTASRTILLPEPKHGVGEHPYKKWVSRLTDAGFKPLVTTKPSGSEYLYSDAPSTSNKETQYFYNGAVLISLRMFYEFRGTGSKTKMDVRYESILRVTETEKGVAVLAVPPKIAPAGGVNKAAPAPIAPKPVVAVPDKPLTPAERKNGSILCYEFEPNGEKYKQMFAEADGWSITTPAKAGLHGVQGVFVWRVYRDETDARKAQKDINSRTGWWQSSMSGEVIGTQGNPKLMGIRKALGLPGKIDWEDVPPNAHLFDATLIYVEQKKSNWSRMWHFLHEWGTSDQMDKLEEDTRVGSIESRVQTIVDSAPRELYNALKDEDIFLDNL